MAGMWCAFFSKGWDVVCGQNLFITDHVDDVVCGQNLFIIDKVDDVTVYPSTLLRYLHGSFNFLSERALNVTLQVGFIRILRLSCFGGIVHCRSGLLVFQVLCWTPQLSDNV